MTATYCGGRWCAVCSRIRAARAIDAYMPVVETWDAPHMVTLTIPNIPGEDLPTALRRMAAVFESCRRAMKRTHGAPLIGIRKIEVTYNERTKTFHPHYHVVVEGREAAWLLRTLWLDRFEGEALSIAQDVRPCDRGALLELFKYTTKLVTGSKKGAMIIPASALDVIFRALRGKRVWQPLGFRLAKEAAEAIESEEIELDQSADVVKRAGEEVWWMWDFDAADWVDRETGETLSDYVPSGVMRKLVASIAGPERVAVVDDG